MKALYMKGFIDGKPMTKMLVDGGATVNLMPYTTFCKLGKGLEDLLETDMMLKDFGGNASKTREAVNIELTIGSKTLPITFFVFDGKGTYSLLLGHDWIHANYCIPSTMHQCLIQCRKTTLRWFKPIHPLASQLLIQPTRSLKIVNASLVDSRKEASSRSMMNVNSRSKQSALKVYFNYFFSWWLWNG
jgi:hypothetical protein